MIIVVLAYISHYYHFSTSALATSLLLFLCMLCSVKTRIFAGSVEPGTISVRLVDSTNTNWKRLALKFSCYSS